MYHTGIADFPRRYFASPRSLAARPIPTQALERDAERRALRGAGEPDALAREVREFFASLD